MSTLITRFNLQIVEQVNSFTVLCTKFLFLSTSEVVYRFWLEFLSRTTKCVHVNACDLINDCLLYVPWNVQKVNIRNLICCVAMPSYSISKNNNYLLRSWEFQSNYNNKIKLYIYVHINLTVFCHVMWLIHPQHVSVEKF